MEENVYTYVAGRAYQAPGAGEVCLEINDVVQVPESSMIHHNLNPEKPDGWVFGMNLRTRQEGYYPGWHLMLTRRRPPPPHDMGIMPPLDPQTSLSMRTPSISEESAYTMLHPPVHPPVSHHVVPSGGSSIRRSSRSGQLSPSSGQHNLAAAYFLTPVLCTHCLDYIWGWGQHVGQQCEECRACFHGICAPHAPTHACTRPHDTLPPPTHPRDVVLA
ncbi:unnamed protein product, partial [Meganyctiphanes norvegica]